MRYLGLDYGSKKIGVAISDEAGSFAFPKETIMNDSRANTVIIDMIAREKVGAVVMGDTRSFSGADNQITAEADAFATALEAQAKIPLHRAREAWSTQEAARFAPPGKRHDDSSAAAIILQRFLDSRPKSE